MINDNYIKMCEQAEEIQKAWKPKMDDKFFDCFDSEIRTLACSKPLNEREIIMGKWKEEAIWLPTQEQLQEMMTMDTSYAKKYNEEEGAIFCGFYIFLDMMDGLPL